MVWVARRVLLTVSVLAAQVPSFGAAGGALGAAVDSAKLKR